MEAFCSLTIRSLLSVLENAEQSLESDLLHLYSSLPDSQGMLLAKDIRDRERGGRAQVRVIEGEAESGSPESMEMLSGVLGQRNFELMDGPPDEAFDQEQKSKLTLYQ